MIVLHCFYQFLIQYLLSLLNYISKWKKHIMLKILTYTKDAHIQYMYAETNYETCHVSNQFTHTDYHAKVHNV